MKNLVISSIFLYLFTHCPLLSAESIQLQSELNKIIVADYQQGSENNNPVLLLHGFLQTKEFSTVTRLSASLNESGYTVVSPTLSLGLNNRNKSLACEAIHTHTLENDTDELSQWIDWLEKKSGKKVTLIGHSAGGPVILDYLSRYGSDKINHVVLISLSYYASGPSANETKAHEAMARSALKNNPDKLATYALNYCKTYPTFAGAFLSYYRWNTEKVSSNVARFKKLISVIIGTADKRIDSGWRIQLHKENKNVISIEGASHFFDQTHEFDLSDTIENILTKYRN